MRSDAKLNALNKSSFKHSINVYWVTSREAPDQLWLEELALSEAVVKKFNLRTNDGHPAAAFLTFEDSFQNFLDAWEGKVSVL